MKGLAQGFAISFEPNVSLDLYRISVQDPFEDIDKISAKDLLKRPSQDLDPCAKISDLAVRTSFRASARSVERIFTKDHEIALEDPRRNSVQASLSGSWQDPLYNNSFS